jgi:hypothetical protein
MGRAEVADRDSDHKGAAGGGQSRVQTLPLLASEGRHAQLPGRHFILCMLAHAVVLHKVPEK